MTPLRRFVSIAAIAGLCGVLPASCTAPIVVVTAGTSVLQAGSSAYINGQLESAIPKPIAVVFDAADASLRQLQFTMGQQALGEFNAYLYALETQRRRISITIEKKSPAVCKVNIRVGVFGDQAISRLILATLQSKLNAPGAPPPEEEN